MWREDSRSGDAPYLGNVFGFKKVVDIEEHFYWHTKLKEVVHNPLDTICRLHLVGGERPLLLPQRGRAALEDHLLNNPVDVIDTLYLNFMLLTHVI